MRPNGMASSSAFLIPLAPLPVALMIGALFFAESPTPAGAQEPTSGNAIPARFLPNGGYAPPTIAPLRAPPPWTEGPRLTGKTTAAHVAALRADPVHASSFWVETERGGSATQTILVIPQFHRSDTQPIDWTSLGEEIRGVQRNIDTLVTRLARTHGLDCIATEGSALNNIQTPMELKQLAAWRRDLDQAHLQAQATFAERGEELAAPLRTIRTILEEALKKRLVLLDGVGVALSRLPTAQRDRVRRLGLEDLALNERGVALLKKVSKIEEALALLEPATQSTTADVMGVMWLDEFPAHAAAVLDPFDAALAALDLERKALLRAGALDAADVLRRFSSRSKLIAGGLIRSAEVRSYHEYYAAVEERALNAAEGVDAGVAPTATKRRLTKAETRKKARLEKQRDRLWKDYTRITEKEREAHAARRVLEALPRRDGAVCAVVMGANHADALVREIEAAAKTQKRTVGVAVVAPFHFN